MLLIGLNVCSIEEEQHGLPAAWEIIEVQIKSGFALQLYQGDTYRQRTSQKTDGTTGIYK